MKRRLMALGLAGLMLILSVGCKKKPDDISSAPVSSQETVVDVSEPINPLTGVEGLSEDAVGKRPVAIMINNVYAARDSYNAQSVQAGLTAADIVYETYAEGGITRLLAVFKDIQNMPRVGSIRSARYSYVDLAMGHDAIYTHAGKNYTQCAPYMNQMGIDNFDLLNKGASFRVQNGKASEHTLYTDGKTLWDGFLKNKWRTELKVEETPWQNFVEEGKEVTPKGGECTYLSVKMSSQYISNFKYDAESKKYVHYNSDRVHKDYNDQSTVSFKNVLVLKTTVTAFANDEKGVVKTHLDGGEGYYVSNGGYTPIKWSKGAAKNPIKITLADGSKVEYNPGNTYVLLVDKNNAVEITSESETAAE